MSDTDAGPVRWVGEQPLRRTSVDTPDIEPGETFDASDAVRRAFPDKLAAVDTDDGADSEDTDADSDAADSDSEDAADDVSAPVDPADYSVRDLRDELAAGAYGPAELDALAAAERAGDDRTTALDAIADAQDTDTDTDGEGTEA
jgi:hypothetical protein